jgi:hypothetical protein
LGVKALARRGHGGEENESGGELFHVMNL